MRLIAPDGSRTWLSLSDYAAQIKLADWQEAVWPSQNGGQKVYVHTVQTWIRKLGPTQLLITCHDKDAPAKSIRYWGTTLLDADAQSVINILTIRWSVEVLFEDDKDLLGADQYQLMSADAIVRFWTLVACAGYFLDEQRVAQENLATWGDARRAIQREQQHNLLRWLESQFAAGLTAEQIEAQLALWGS